MVSQRQYNVERSTSMGYPVAFIFMKHQTKNAYTAVWNHLEVICGKKTQFRENNNRFGSFVAKFIKQKISVRRHG